MQPNNEDLFKYRSLMDRLFPILKRYLLPQPNLKLAFMKDFSYITNSHPAYIENLYQDYVKDPSSVDPEMKKFFEGFDFAVSSGKDHHWWMRQRFQKINARNVGHFNIQENQINLSLL